jgi:arylsulfatase A-like enzyme
LRVKATARYCRSVARVPLRFARATVALEIAMLAVAATPVPASSAVARPNILVFLTDDQRTDSMDALPKTLEWFADAGTSFPNGLVTTPLCCPSRASILSGRYAHNTGVHTNSSVEEVYAFDQSATVEAYLQAAGYRTAIAGKFLNLWNLQDTPPFWDHYAIMNQAYNNPKVNIDGDYTQHFGEYSTELVGEQAIDFLDDFDHTDDAAPWFLYVTPFAPHAPYTASATYADSPVDTWPGNPAVFESDRSDKPTWVQTTVGTLASANVVRTGQYRTLFSVDDVVDDVMTHLDELGESNTLAIFMSDNGYTWSEHGINANKRVPYLPSVEVPFFVRWPGHVEEGATDERIVAGIDVAPTALDAANVAEPDHPAMDGLSVLSGSSRSRILLEYWRSGDDVKWPSWSAELTSATQYIEWYDDDLQTITFKEYYDLANDPWQLVNLLDDGNGANDPDAKTLSKDLAVDRVCAASTCVDPIEPDTTAPTAVTGLAAAWDGDKVTLEWEPSTDAVGVVAYRVFRNGVFLGRVGPAILTFEDATASPGETLTYKVRAKDRAGNRSPAGKVKISIP